MDLFLRVNILHKMSCCHHFVFCSTTVLIQECKILALVYPNDFCRVVVIPLV